VGIEPVVKPALGVAVLFSGVAAPGLHELMVAHAGVIPDSRIKLVKINFITIFSWCNALWRFPRTASEYRVVIMPNP
jgi:hypothetical protein